MQAGREDHIAPAESVWRITRHFSGPVEFLLAGSGHIAAWSIPPAANKYQYWVGDSSAPSLAALSRAHRASRQLVAALARMAPWRQSAERVPASGKRVPGGKGDSVIEDAPGRYVKTR
jgi:polyhydroxyalkanoate synthase subunit PhaC